MRTVLRLQLGPDQPSENSFKFGGIMEKTVHIVCSATVLILLSGCGEQLASNAQKAADQIAAEATRAASRELDEFKDIVTRPVSTGLLVPKKVAAKNSLGVRILA